jgi:hypothetical protein
MTSSLAICTQLHKAMHALTQNFRLPPIKELWKTIIMEQLLENI